MLPQGRGSDAFYSLPQKQWQLSQMSSEGLLNSPLVYVSAAKAFNSLWSSLMLCCHSGMNWKWTHTTATAWVRSELYKHLNAFWSHWQVEQLLGFKGFLRASMSFEPNCWQTQVSWWITNCTIIHTTFCSPTNQPSSIWNVIFRSVCAHPYSEPCAVQFSATTEEPFVVPQNVLGVILKWNFPYLSSTRFSSSEFHMLPVSELSGIQK